MGNAESRELSEEEKTAARERGRIQIAEALAHQHGQREQVRAAAIDAKAQAKAQDASQAKQQLSQAIAREKAQSQEAANAAAAKAKAEKESAERAAAEKERQRREAEQRQKELAEGEQRKRLAEAARAEAEKKSAARAAAERGEKRKADERRLNEMAEEIKRKQRLAADRAKVQEEHATKQKELAAAQKLYDDSVAKDGGTCELTLNSGKPKTTDSIASWQPRKEPISNPKDASRPRTQLDTTERTLGASSNRANISRSTEPKSASAATKPSLPLKRTSTDSGFTDDRRRSLPKIHKRAPASMASPNSPQSSSSVEELDELPDWYQKLPKGKSTQNESASIMVSLKKEIMKATEQQKKERSVDDDIFGKICEKLHALAFVRVDGQTIKNYRMLHPNDGLPQLFREGYTGGVEWPYYIKADAKELYTKWWRKIFDTDLMRGIQLNKGEKNTASMIPDYEGKVSASRFGNNSLLNGQWWPTWITAVRDGAHAASQAGIAGKEGEGAYSCVMSGGHDYDDKDEGDVVYYCGTDSKDGNITPNTKMMIENVANNRPVRLIRSHKLQSRFAPEKGVRYDGLYNVVEMKELPDKTDPTNRRQRHQFKLVRQPRQDPIRGGEGPQKRPTRQELAAHQKDTVNKGFRVD